MKINTSKYSRGSFLMLLEIVIVLAIVLLLAQKMLKSYFSNPVTDTRTESIANEAGINTGSYQSMVQSTKDKLKNITEQRQSDLETYGNLK